MCDFTSGWVAGMAGLVVGHPFDTVKVNQQTKGIGTWQCTKTIYHENGIKGFFRGLAFPLVANGAMNSLFFGVYASTLDVLTNRHRCKKFDPASCELLHTDKTHSRMQVDFPKPSQTQILVAGGVAGFAQLLISCPVEVIKIKLQTQQKKLGTSVVNKIGPISLLKDLTISSGVRGLYQGAVSQCYRDVIASAFYMYLYELCSGWVKNWSRDKHESVNVLGIFMSGGIAGTVSWWTILPFDVVKSRIQAGNVQHPKYKGLTHCSKIILKEQGVKGFFRGFWPMSLRAFPVNGVTFIALEWMKSMCQILTERRST